MTLAYTVLSGQILVCSQIRFHVHEGEGTLSQGECTLARCECMLARRDGTRGGNYQPIVTFCLNDINTERVLFC